MQSHLKNNDTDENIKLDKLNQGISDEPNASLVSGNITLPEDMFKSHFCYILYEIYHFKLAMFFVILLVISIFSVLTFNVHGGYIVIFIFLFLFVIFGLIVSLATFNESIEYENFQIKLLLEVITRKPPVEGIEWRAITYNMNQYLCDKRLWPTPYYFYCEHRCYKAFRDLIKGRKPDAQSASSTGDGANTQSNTDARDAPNDANKPFTFSADPILEEYFIKAAEIQKQAVREYWRKQYPDPDVP
ncbi:hypothetical protein SUVZ_13G1870 [Saccharomyces uvarum]|uniref:Uncharacterized protein n=1 Tax=Saccharomyces uvarum TaxID=230603 RepID=A0ABN8WJ51_SACUV|nr:hypothetical protein SUVZ_13G1870 [Saccharomyces uvarum]